MFVVSPAQAQWTAWDATLTAKDLGANTLGCTISTGKRCTDTSVLTDGDFTIGGVNYTVREIRLSPFSGFKTLTFEPNGDAAPLADIGLTLRVGTTQFPLNANRLNTDKTAFRWDTTTLSWSVDDTVSLILTAAATRRLDVTYGDIKLLIGPNDGLDVYSYLNDDDETVYPNGSGRYNWVQVSPTGMQEIVLKLTWLDTSDASVTGSVEYVFHGMDGGTRTLTWTGSGDTATLNMYSRLGSAGYPRVEFTIGGNDGDTYRIQFISNGDWQNANNLLRQIRMTTSGP